MDDPELLALGAIAKALADLDEEQRRNVLAYVNTRYATSRQAGPAASTTAPALAGAGSTVPAAHGFTDLGEFFDAADPQSEAERALVVAYWLQAVEGAPDFESFPLNKQLKHLGHSVSNITRALDSLMELSPRLIIQTSKSGNSKQARKRYKVTREGTKRVEQMIESKNGGEHGN